MCFFFCLPLMSFLVCWLSLSLSLFPPPSQGFRGQTFDVTGEAEQAYSIISDGSFDLNAQFDVAYTTGVYFDPISHELLNMRPSGTWITQVSVRFPSGDVAHVSIEEPPVHDPMCHIKATACIHGGFLRLVPTSSEPGSLPPSSALLYSAGTVTTLIGTYSLAGMTATLQRRKSYSRILLESTLHDSPIEITVDYVPPPSEWSAPVGDDGKPDAQYVHLNLGMKRISLSGSADGILGSSVRLRYDEHGKPILKTSSKDGVGLLERPLESYKLEDLMQWPSMR